MKFTKGNNLSTGRPKGSKNTRTTELKNLLRDLLFDKDQMIQDITLTNIISKELKK